MNKAILILILFLVTLTKVDAQVNLVPNGDFEIYSTLPTTNGQSNRAVGWNNVNGDYTGATGSPDYFNILSYSPAGSIAPFSGNGQMGLIIFQISWREYISTLFNSSMISGHKYNISFYLTNGTGFYVYTKVANNFGIHFSNNPLYQAISAPIPVIPQIEITSIINSFNNWQHFSFNYIADSSYKFITIGNFRDDAHTIISSSGQYGAYYFIDKIKIIPIINIEGDTVICKGSSTILKATVDNTVKWADNFNPNTIISTDSIITVSPNVTTTYYAYGISDTASFTVHVVNPSQLNIGNDTTLCNGDSLLLNANIPFATYLWQSNSTNSTYKVFTQGTYWVRVTIDSSCIASDTIVVNYIPPLSLHLIKDTTICEGIPLSVTIPNGAYNILWYDGDTNKSHILNQAGIYYVTATNKCGAVNDSIKLIYKDCSPVLISIPNSFTPNGDGKNEVFKIETLKEINDFHLYIYNRWGNLVFESEDINKGWDGTYKGKTIPDGVYVYLFTGTIKDTNEPIKEKGRVTVIR